MKISKLHYISQELNGKSHVQLVEEACAAGVNWVQLRMKNKSYEESLSIAHAVKEICRKYKAVFIVNDHVALAKEVKADGVHLGKQDMAPLKAREILGDGHIIGGTSNTMEDIRTLQEAKVDYIGLGPFRFTTTKDNLSPILGVEGYQKLLEQCREENISIPVIAIGGIMTEDLPTLMKTGIHGVAVSSLINQSTEKKKVVNIMTAQLMC